MIHRTALLALGLAVAAPLQAQTHSDILEANDMTRAAFDSLLYVIAADPALTAQYEGLRAQ
jgi:hypothetical protein